MKVLIDTDPGTDDALAIIMALSSPELSVQGLTTVGGNATLADTTRNALRLLDHLGVAGLPVSRGSSRPLNGSFHYGYYFHGAAGLGVRLPSPRSETHPERATELIVRLASAFPGQLTIIALGPLTNIARALTAEPHLAEWIPEIVVMGGAVGVPGNVTPYAEFNIYNDPEAADIVLSSGIPIKLVGLDVCLQTSFTRKGAPWVEGESKSARLASTIIGTWFAGHPHLDRYDLCDPLATVAAIQSSLLTFRQAQVRVETDDPETRGRTVAIYDGGQVGVAVGVDADRALAEIRRLLEGDSS